VCSCPAGYEGDPYTGCIADPCSQSPCGINAECSKNGRNGEIREGLGVGGGVGIE